MSASVPPPLSVDDKRVAVDSMRGYSYQIVRRVALGPEPAGATLY
jgi:hypothetical protein